LELPLRFLCEKYFHTVAKVLFANVYLKENDIIVRWHVHPCLQNMFISNNLELNLFQFCVRFSIKIVVIDHCNLIIYDHPIIYKTVKYMYQSENISCCLPGIDILIFSRFIDDLSVASMNPDVTPYKMSWDVNVSPKKNNKEYDTHLLS